MGCVPTQSVGTMEGDGGDTFAPARGALQAGV